MITQTQIQTKIAPEKTSTTCATCPKFKPTGEGRGRGLCLLSNTMVKEHHPLTQDCRLNLASEAKAKEKTIDTVGKQIKETRSVLEKIKRRSFVKSQLIPRPLF